MIQLYKIYGYKDRLEKQFYVTREHGIFSLYYDNAVLNLLKKPRVAGTCTLGETGESPVWEKGTTMRSPQKKTGSPVVSTEMTERQQRWHTAHLSQWDKTVPLAGKHVLCSPSKPQVTRFALSDFLGEGKTSLHQLICRLLYIFITLSNLFSKKKKDRGLDRMLITKEKTFGARFGSTYTKIGTIQRRLAWPLRKDDTQIREAFHIFKQMGPN